MHAVVPYFFTENHQCREIFTTAKINLMHNDLTGVMRAGNGGLNTYGGKIQNNPTCLLSNASVLLFFVVMHAEAVQANDYKTLVLFRTLDSSESNGNSPLSSTMRYE
jgi:hypothetical protein